MFKEHFRIVKPLKPKASRDKSSETFLVGHRPQEPDAAEVAASAVLHERRVRSLWRVAKIHRSHGLKRLEWAAIAGVSGPSAGAVLSRKESRLNNQWFSKIAVWLVIALVLFTVFKQFDTRGAAGAAMIGYSDFLEEVRSKQHQERACIQEGQGGTEIVAITTDDRKVRTTATYLDRGLVGDLINNGVKFDVKPREEPSPAHDAAASAGARCCC